MKPEKLELYIGGYTGPSYSVELKRGALLYRCWSDGIRGEEKHRVKPSPEAWAKFWDRLDEVGFWSWGGGAYHASRRILDGTSWSVEISKGKCNVEAHGCNAYPPTDPESGSSDECSEPGSRFDEFRAAVSELLGGHAFR